MPTIYGESSVIVKEPYGEGISSYSMGRNTVVTGGSGESQEGSIGREARISWSLAYDESGEYLWGGITVASQDQYPDDPWLTNEIVGGYGEMITGPFYKRTDFQELVDHYLSYHNLNQFFMDWHSTASDIDISDFGSYLAHNRSNCYDPGAQDA